jgi:AraC-like DNA-binding protein
MARLFTDHLRALRREIWPMSTAERTALRTPTLDLLSRAYASVACRKRPSARAETFRRIREYVLRNLADGELTPSRVAAATGVSIRYVHRLFAGEATTAAAWIRAQRIERCKLDLSNPRLAQRSITQIAFGWGFNDVGHFGKVFRRAVGVAPGEFRRLAASTGRWND